MLQWYEQQSDRPKQIKLHIFLVLANLSSRGQASCCRFSGGTPRHRLQCRPPSAWQQKRSAPSRSGLPQGRPRTGTTPGQHLPARFPKAYMSTLKLLPNVIGKPQAQMSIQFGLEVLTTGKQHPSKHNNLKTSCLGQSMLRCRQCRHFGWSMLANWHSRSKRLQAG